MYSVNATMTVAAGARRAGGHANAVAVGHQHANDQACQCSKACSATSRMTAEFSAQVRMKTMAARDCSGDSAFSLAFGVDPGVRCAVWGMPTEIVVLHKGRTSVNPAIGIPATPYRIAYPPRGGSWCVAAMTLRLDV
jgi:hypothetical protein